MIIKIIGILVLSIIGGICYRIGGSANGVRWAREVGLCTCMTFVMILLGQIHWSLILCYGALYGLTTTYFKKKNTDATTINWILVGIAFGISMLPLVVAHHLWIGFWIRTLVTAILVPVYQQKLSGIVAGWFYKTWHKDVTDEFGRGFICIVTLPLLLIGA